MYADDCQETICVKTRAVAKLPSSDKVVKGVEKDQKCQKWRSDTPRKMMESGKIEDGGMAEWLKAAVLKTVSVERRSGVRIPLPPPLQILSGADTWVTVRFRPCGLPDRREVFRR